MKPQGPAEFVCDFCGSFGRYPFDNAAPPVVFVFVSPLGVRLANKPSDEKGHASAGACAVQCRQQETLCGTGMYRSGGGEVGDLR